MKSKTPFRISLIILSLLFMGGSSQDSGQKATLTPVASRYTTTIALTRRGNYLIVDAKLNGKTRKFILDGSSDRTMLNSMYIHEKRSTTKGRPEETAGKNTRNDNRIDFYGTKQHGSNLETMDMSYIEDSTGIKVYGMIGYDLIKFYELFFNYKEKNLTLVYPEKQKRTPAPPGKRSTPWIFSFTLL